MTRPHAALVLAEVRGQIRRLCGQPALEVDGATALDEIEGLDSLRIIEAVALLEERFGVAVDPLALDGLASVGDIVRIITSAR